MAIDLFVQRGAGDRRGEDIVDPLISEVFVATARGRNELDHVASNKADVTYGTIYRSNVRLGQLAEVNDALQGRTYRAKVVGIRHNISPTGAVTTLTLEREVNF